MKLTPIETGTKPGYEDYRGEIFDEGYNKIGGWNYDKKQALFIGSFDDLRKNFYHKSVSGLIQKMTNYKINNNQTS